MIFEMELVGVVNRFWYDRPVNPGHPDYDEQLRDWDNYTALVYEYKVELIELLINDDKIDLGSDLTTNDVIPEISEIPIYRKWEVDHDDDGKIGLTTDYSVEGLLFDISYHTKLKSLPSCGVNLETKTLFVEVSPNAMFANLKLGHYYKLVFENDKWHLLTEFS